MTKNLLTSVPPGIIQVRSDETRRLIKKNKTLREKIQRKDTRIASLLLTLRDHKRVKAENRRTRRIHQVLVALIKTIIILTAKDGKAPSISRFKNLTGVDIRSLYCLSDHFPNYTNIVHDELNLKISRK